MTSRLPLLTSLALLAGGLIVGLAVRPWEIGGLLFSIGVANLGYYSLLVGRDRAVALVLIFVGVVSCLANLIRLIIFAV